MSKTVVGVAVFTAVGLSLAVVQRRAQPRFMREIPWATRGVWLKAETHVHTRFSDGSHTVDSAVDRAVANGCDVLAVTDHIDIGLKAATPEYHAALAAARARVPGVVLLTGFEWNVPPGKGQDHAVVFTTPALDDATVWGEFRTRFDDTDKEGENPQLAAEAFAWLGEKAGGGDAPVVFLNHPARRAPDVAAVSRQLEWLSRIGQGIFVGAEGAPGHQKASPLGAYGRALDDRWDPAIASPGGAWDQRLADGQRLWGALATADFHNEKAGDYWPCEFSTTWLYAPERSASGVLGALRAGSFVGVHGGIAREVQLTALVDGLPRPAMAGEVVRARGGTSAILELRALVPESDWEGQPNRLDEVEFIGISADGARTLARVPWTADGAAHPMTLPAGRFVVRARGRRIVEGAPDLLFYTNPIFFN